MNAAADDGIHLMPLTASPGPPVLALFGGFTGASVAGDLVLIDTAMMTSLCVGNGDDNVRAPAPRFAHTSALVPSVRGAGKKAVLVFGGVSSAEDLNDVCVWCP